MKVIKRNGVSAEVDFNKITDRIRNLSRHIKDNHIDPIKIAQKVCNSIYDGVTTQELDILSSEIAMSLSTVHPDYGTVAGHIVMSNLHKNTSGNFYEVIKKMHENNVITDDLMDIVEKNQEKIQQKIDYNRDFDIDYFGIKTLEKSYLNKDDKTIIERPQDMWMRVSLGIHYDDLDSAFETYDYMSLKYFTHATPTLFNAGTKKPQLSSCFLMAMKDDSIKGIYDTLADCAQISKYAGGIGLHIHNIRATGADIGDAKGACTGIVPMLKIFNDTACYVNQCFTPDTMVYTKYEHKPISKIRMGDEVITLDGTMKKVLGVKKNTIKKEILRVRTTHSFEPIELTKEHEVYVVKHQSKTLNYSLIKNRLNKQLVEPKYIPAAKLELDDLIGYPVIQYNKESLDDQDESYYRMVGIMLGDGHITKNRNESGITVNKKSKIETYDFVKCYLQDKNIRFWEQDQINCVQIRWTTNESFKLVRNDIYNDEDEKYINGKFYNLNEKNTLSLIKGMLETDGSIDKEIYYSTSSYELAHGIRYLLYKIGILSSGNISNNVGETHEIRPGEYITTKKISYTIRIPKTVELMKTLGRTDASKYLKYFECNGMLWTRVKHIQDFDYEGDVFDLNIEDNHNYVVSSFGLVHNSGKRNGSFAIYLSLEHPDIFKFLEMKKNHGNEAERCRDLFYAVWVSDLLMKRVKENGKWSLFCPSKIPYDLNDMYGDEYERRYVECEEKGLYNKQVNAQDLWFEICNSQIETGVPYILYKDAINKKSNQKNVGVIKSSNLCVAPETRILTSEGYKEIKSLENKVVEVWNGKEFSETTVKKTGENQKLLKIETNNGHYLECTPYHKFYIETSSKPANKSKPKRIEARHLELGMKLIRCEFPVINSNEDKEMISPYTHGMFCADGTYNTVPGHNKQQCKYSKWNNTDFCKRHQNFKKDFDNDKCSAMSNNKLPWIWLYGEKKNLLEHLDWLHYTTDEDHDRLNVAINRKIEEKYKVPLDYNIKTRITWLEGYCDGDGCVIEHNGIKNIQFASIHKEFLQDVSLMLNTLGISVALTKGHKSGMRNLPKNDGTGGHKEYMCKETHRINIDAKSLIKLKQLGFSPKRLDISEVREPHHQTNRFEKITGIIDEDRYEDTYCFNEPLEHKGIFNGIITGQCTEVMQYSSSKETAVCNLASIGLPMFVNEDGTYDYEKLHNVTKIVTRNLNKVIDVNYYPTVESKTSNMRHRPIGIGVQGLADVYMKMKCSFDSEEAKMINIKIFETIYHGAMESSMELAKGSMWYETFDRNGGSPLKNGLFQFDLWGKSDMQTGRYDWDALRKDVMKYGVRNSLLVAPMPTASTAQILGNNECFEPYTSNIYLRRTLSGEFVVINKHLINDLIEAGVWNENVKNQIILDNGSVKNLDIPNEMKEIYKTSWEMSQKAIIDQAADRGIFVCQSQSMNLFIERPDIRKLSSMHFYTHSKGLKTGVYYLRTTGATSAIKFTIEPSKKSCESCSG